MKINKLEINQEPEVAPMEPEVLPETAPLEPVKKPRPSEDDPFAIPAPKVDPTPKAGGVMTKLKKVNKIKTLEEFAKEFKKNPNIAQFSKENTLDDAILTKALALSAVMTLAVTDKAPLLFQAYQELDNFQNKDK